ncbi:sensor histidine kinase [Nocardia fusca]|jgi:signal transduction histidine kinase|uniref:sensor histidine kinase n=1 Tax=Nocardia fusca TaxID=941183 RepID=UPI0007A75FF0|nr:histidine kinase [Nocardia fusca]
MQRWSALSATTRDVVVAGGWFLFGVLLYLAGFHMMFAPEAQAGPLWPRIAILGLASAVLPVRRRAPITAMVLGLIPLVMDLSLGPTLPVWLVYTDLIYAAVVYGTRRQMQGAVVAWLTLSATAAGVVLAITGDWHLMSLALVLAAAFVGTSLWWGLTVRAHKETADAERARARALSLVAELDRRAAVADERKAMARDLHDVIAGHLSAIALQSEAALGGLDGTADPRLAGVLGAIRANSVEALREMRTMIGLLRREDDADQTTAPGRLAQLPGLVTAARQAGMRVGVRLDLGETVPAGAVDQAAYRIVQEAVTNVMKHAPGQEVDIDVHAESTTLVLTVRNPLSAGPLPAPEPAADRRGLSNMRERAAALGGTLRAGPESGAWWVRARLPLAAVPGTAGDPR